MGYALYVSFDRDLPDVEGWAIAGKVLANNLKPLDRHAVSLGVMPLSEMISVSQDDAEDLLGEDLELPAEFEEQWLDPSEGLNTIRHLIQFVNTSPDQVQHPTELLNDLVELEEYLAIAQQHNAQFHLTPDF